MKMALYIEDGLNQFVLTPETDTERRLVDELHARRGDIKMHKGSFYGCRGWWTRQGADDSSLILAIK